MHSIMDVATVVGSCFKNNAHEMMVHMLMSCSYGCTDARQTPGVLHARPKVEPVDPPHSPTLGTKVRAFNANCRPLPTLMITATTGMGAVPVSNLAFYCSSQDGR
jgi:hypothetical protein